MKIFSHFKSLVSSSASFMLTLSLLLGNYLMPTLAAIPEEFPVCVGISGNGVYFWAHFGAMARIVEGVGQPVNVMSGGSSATLTMFVMESMHLNPYVTDSNISQAESIARLSFLLKSVEAFSDDDLFTLFFPNIGELQFALVQSGVLPRLQSPDPIESSLAVAETLAIIAAWDEGQRSALVASYPSLINPEVVNLLATSPDPSLHAEDVLKSASVDFNVEGPVMFIRPGILNFEAFAAIIDVVASFYRGYEPVDMMRLGDILEQCATPAFGKEWPEIANQTMTVDGAASTCGDEFADLILDYLQQRTPAIHPTRLTDPGTGGGAVHGGEKLYIVGQSSGITGDSLEKFEIARIEYNQGFINATAFQDLDFDDVLFGYWGIEELLDRAEMNLPALGFNDLKSQKFFQIASANVTWFDLLTRSPAEPGISRGVETLDDFVTLGGWADLTPGQVLTSMGCTNKLFLIQRPGYAGTFQIGVAELLGATQDDLDDMFDLDNPRSGWQGAAQVPAVTSICADWNSFMPGDIRGLLNDAYDAPIVARSADVSALFPEANTAAGTTLMLPGCQALIEESDAPSTSPVADPTSPTMQPVASPTMQPVAMPTSGGAAFMFSAVSHAMAAMLFVLAIISCD